MKMTLSTDHAARILMEDDNANWSWAGARALVEYLDEIDEDMELDVVAIRCDYSEYSSLQDWAEDYFADGLKDDGLLLELDEDGDLVDEDAADTAIRDYIENYGTLIEFEGGIIVSSF